MGDIRNVAAKRLDSFVDGAFAFAVTILVVGTGGATESFDGLLRTFAYVPAFVPSLIIILSFWWAHRQFSIIIRRTDTLNDMLSILIMFVIQIYVFPVAFLMRALLHWLSDGALPGTGLLPEQIRTTYAIFGGGFALLSAAYSLMYFRASIAHGKLSVFLSVRLIARRAAIWWMLCAVAGLTSIFIGELGGLERLIWLPLCPYLMLPFLFVLRHNTVQSVLRRSRPRKTS